MYKVFIDGREGTTGLRIDSMLENRSDIEIIPISAELRKDETERGRLMNMADVVFLCLPDSAAREAVKLVTNDHTRIIDASTAHRTADNWAYGFAELSAEHRRKIETYQYISNPGCHATGFISLVYPLVKMGILPADAYLTCHSITGYSGGGKKMIAQYEAEERDFALFSPRQYGLGLNHKHLPEMKKQSCIDHEPIFNPVVADFPRGMATTVPLHLGQLTKAYTAGDIRKAYAEFYAGQQLIEIMPEGQPEGGFLETNAVVDSNLLQIFVFGEGERLEVVSRFDNLGKGASGAAVQNMNICLGLDETIGI
ncbi:MAG: N-acetyl-gamma-glutamyl-phosphate reductase [Ruminococcaceae bacterium]|nr:N-acetyl-gamma-glutamyl-phosphate reductase [Oscillospiraceae bacterium]